jgi:hypothetical protein
MIPNISSSPCYLVDTSGFFKFSFGGVRESQLKYSILESIEIDNFKDVVVGVSIFCSLPIYTHNPNVFHSYKGPKRIGKRVYGIDGADYSYYMDPYTAVAPLGATIASFPTFTPTSLPNNNDLYELCTAKSASVLQEEIRTTSVFYKLADIDLKDLELTGPFPKTPIAVPIEAGVVNALSSQIQLVDEINAHKKIIANSSYVYNSRLNLVNIKAILYNGYNPSISFPICKNPTASSNNYNSVKLYFFIDFESTNENNACVVTDVAVDSFEFISPYIYYPDVKAIRVVVERTRADTVVEYKELSMEEHIGLSGSLYSDELDELTGWTTIKPVDAVESSYEDRVENFPNKIYASLVDNPYVFVASGISTIGNGELMRASTATKALSQGQFGQFPIYIFSTDGIWALEVGSDGKYTSKHPATRDVCNNENSITQLDGAVAFTTNKGLMILEGSITTLISDMLDGRNFAMTDLPLVKEGADTIKTITGIDTIIDDVSDDISFLNYITGCKIAYDYAHARLIISNVAYKYQYLFSIKSGTFAKMYVGLNFKNTINNYPDTYIQDNANVIHNITDYIDNNDYTSRIKGVVCSRPIDFAAPDSLKTIIRLLNRGRWNKNTSFVKMALYGSRDREVYYRIKSVKGSPFKVFRIVFYFNLLPVEKIYGTTFDIDVRFSNKIR